MSRKILVTPTFFLRPENNMARKRLEEFADEVIYNDLGRPLQPEEILERLSGVEGYLAGLDYITDAVIKKSPACLKAISRLGVGVDQVDLAGCRERNILVTNTPNANAVSVSELAFGLMLCLARNIPRLHSAIELGQWPVSIGFELYGKTLGIVGLGAIGRHLAVRAAAFGMTVIAHDPHCDKQFAKEHGITIMSLEELLTVSDFISLHLPLNDKTRYIIGKAQIATIKNNAIIINTARGGLIDEGAVAEALKNEELGGVGLDVFEQEPLVNSPLTGLDRVVMVPHVGAQTGEAIANMGMMAVDNLIEAITIGTCKYMV